MFTILLIASITGLLFNATQIVLTPVENEHLSLYVCICLKSKRNTDVTALTII